jgi:hypothetical protein
MVSGTLNVSLEAREGEWHPEGSSAPPGFTIEAFAEEGGALLTPGPLLRVPVGSSTTNSSGSARCPCR